MYRSLKQMGSNSSYNQSSRFRRVRYLFAYVQDVGIIDLVDLFHGTVRDTLARDIYVFSLVSRRAHLLDERQAILLLTVPSDRCVTFAEILEGFPSAEEELRDLVRRGLVVSIGARSAELARREQSLAASYWNIYAAIYHCMRRWKDVNAAADGQSSTGSASRDVVRQGAERSPPSHFYSSPDSAGTQYLAWPVRNSHLYALLEARASRRAFDPERELGCEDLSTILYYAFGCHGILRGRGRTTLLKKTSPSGGSLHPIEVYPLIRAVSGVPSGLYHYSVEHHVLEVLNRMNAEEVSDFGYVATAGQGFARTAHVLLLLTARFDREFWKYREHDKAYGVLHMDVGHLSQTVYLVCTDLGLGACITGAINDGNIDEQLGLDGVREGALAVIACGVPASAGSEEEPTYSPYFPNAMERMQVP